MSLDPTGNGPLTAALGLPTEFPADMRPAGFLKYWQAHREHLVRAVNDLAAPGRPFELAPSWSQDAMSQLAHDIALAGWMGNEQWRRNQS